MGFREYNPGLNRFLTRNMYAGALTDMTLGSDPWNTNRYMFGGGNPISRVEIDGDLNVEEGDGGGFTTENLEICGPDCTLDGSNPTGAKPDSVRLPSAPAGMGMPIISPAVYAAESVCAVAGGEAVELAPSLLRLGQGRVRPGRRRPRLS
jgi:hypothetical protein